MPRARSETPTSPRYGQPLELYSDVSYFRDPPGPVSTEPIVVDSGATHLSLTWGKPLASNSAPVTAYKIEAWTVGHEGGAIWKELGLTPINSFDVFNLHSNVDYIFRVTPRNRYGWGPSVQTSSPLSVGGVETLPEFTKILPGQLKALLDSSFTLECSIRGAPRPQIKWYKDGIPLTDSQRVQIKQLGSACALLILNVSTADSGRYTCEATNSKGRVSTFARLQVVTDPKLYEADTKLKEIVLSENACKLGDTLPMFIMRLRDRRVQVTYPVRLTCQVVGYPTPEVIWCKDDIELTSNRRYLITKEGQYHTIELSNAAMADSGIYTCTARNELGSISCHCSLVVDKGIRAYITPEFCMPLDPLYIYQREQVIRLAAKVEAYPAVGVSWFRNGIRLRPSRRIAATLDQNGFVELIIADSDLCDAGYYACVASNAVGKVESSCRVTIEETDENQRQSQVPSISRTDLPYSKQPLFVVKPRSSEAYEGDTVIIFCEVVGDPKPDVVWLRDFLNPEYYKDAPHFRRIGDGPEYRLEIPRAKLDFTGTYSIIASNCHGEAKAVISLQIYAKDILNQPLMEEGAIRQGNVEILPQFLRHLHDLRCCDGDAIKLECHVEALPEPVIIWEKDGRVLPSDKDWAMSYDGIKATLSIPRVFPEDEGEYTCVAKNTLGRTLSSACIIVDLPEEKENMLHRQLARPRGFLSASSTPHSTPRSTPNRGFSPMPLSYRHTSIDLEQRRHQLQSTAISAPKFLALPHNRVVEEGSNVRFMCAIVGHPTPWSTWDKDGMVVPPIGRITVREVEDLRFLEIEEVCFEDAGLYRITLENDYGRIEATARLDVISNSRHSRHTSARRVRTSSSRRNIYLHRRIMGPSTAIGGRMALAAGSRGFSMPTTRCTFYHNGKELERNARCHFELLHQEVMLRIDNVNEADQGLYTCVLETEQGSLSTSTVVNFQGPTTDESQRLRITQPLPETTAARANEMVDLCCEISCAQPYTYYWTRDGDILPNDDEFNYIDHGNGILCLRITNAFDLDSGMYACVLSTDDGVQCTTAGQLVVQEHCGLRADGELLVLKAPLPLIVHAGADAVYCARVHPRTAPATWVVCGREVRSDSLNCTTESYSDGARVLRLHDVDYSHSGEVQLVITHSDDSIAAVRSYTTLLVLPPLEYGDSRREEAKAVPAWIVQGPEDLTALIGGVVKLFVRYEAYPAPTVQWLKACRPISERSSNITIDVTDNSTTLTITDITADDSGKYTVEIMNGYGSDVGVASVAVEGPPEPPSGKPSVSQGSDRVAVAWCGPAYDGGCMLTGFIIEMQVSTANGEEGAWHEVAEVVDSLAYTVKNLSPNGVYRFRVRAQNIHGKSGPGQASDQVKLRAREVSKEDFQQSVCVRSGGDFRHRFDILEELGKGRFGIVYKVQDKDEPHQVLAAKVIKCIKSRDRQKVQEEIAIMKQLQHPKLLQLAASFESPREIVMIMEYITGGELFERVVADDFTLTELDCILFLRQVCEGVAYMHDQKIVHLDLKPENIMCHTRTSHQIKIIDFGLAQRLENDAAVRVLFGTPEFIPPEIISYEPIGFQSDMWSVGVICYVLLSGLSPFMGDSDVDTFSNITRADYDFDDEAFDCVSQEAKDFISNLLVHRKEDRCTAQQCLQSKWLAQSNDENVFHNKICTDKLKKFIIRRKWQKTGNAIRALGRMATLSASRRNSSVSASGSLPNSPRPSISGISMFNPNISVHMSAVNEEDDNFNLDSLDVSKQRKSQKMLRVRDKSQCSERSDSGYSECSNCSLCGNMPCICFQTTLVPKDQEAEVDGDLQAKSIGVPHEILKSKLEEIANSTNNHTREAPRMQPEQCASVEALIEINLNTTASETLHLRQPQPQTEHVSVCEVESEKQATLEQKTISPPPSREAIMPSDFTNTIKMRKKSLESNAAREKHKPPIKPPFDTAGKVSLLKNKFNCPGDKSVSKFSSSPPSKSKDCMDALLRNNRNRLSNRYACNNKNAAAKGQLSASVPSSPVPKRADTPIRLSSRVREVTERLAQQHTVSTAKRAELQKPAMK